MKIKKIKAIHIESEFFLTLAVFIVMAGMLLLSSHSEVKHKELSADIFNAQTNSLPVMDESILFPRSLPQESPDTVKCEYAAPAKAEFTGRFLAISRKNFVVPGEVFMMQVYIQNNSNVPWFSSESGCENGPIVNLGTNKDKDRSSPFFNNLINMRSNWAAPNRIRMESKRVSPYDIATFTFWAKAPQEPGLYREFFAPVAEGMSWIEDDALFSVDIKVGDVQLNKTQKEYLTYIQKSANLSQLDLTGDKKIEVQLAKQKMFVKIGDTVVRMLSVSTGAKKTPTPRGTYNIISKQEVRVAVKKPRYIMPFFQMFKNSGYGLHALPSLANDKGVFWTEALNHIGRPVSHGCIRLLPKDAEFVWNFTELGTKMVVTS